MVLAKIGYLAESTRPKTLIAGISPVLIGTVLAFPVFDPFIFLLTILFAATIQIGTNFANDYLDFLKGSDRSDRKGPRRATAEGLLSAKTMTIATIFTFFLSGILGFYLSLTGGYFIACLAVISIICGYFYTGGPYPLAYVGLGDLFVLIFFGIVATAGTFFLQTGVLTPTILIASLAPGLFSLAILVCNNLRDYEEDKISNKRTTVVRFGIKFGQSLYAISLMLASSVPLLIVMLHSDRAYVLLACFTLVKAIPLIRLSHQEEIDPTLLPKTAKLLVMYTFLFCLGWLA